MTSFATTADGTKIAYAEAGRPWRPALVLTHSLGSDHHLWAPQIEALKSQYYIVAIDNIGHGDSDAPPTDYTLAEMAEAVLAVAAHAELEQFHYCGLSVGGITGQWLGIHHPQRLLSLTLCNTAAKIGDPETWSERRRIATEQGMEALREGVIARWFSAEFPARHPELFAAVTATFVATNPTGYAGVCAALGDADVRDQVASITTPTLIIGGLNDLSTPIEQARWLHEQINGSRLVELDAAHLSNLDRATEFTPALESFLAAHTP